MIYNLVNIDILLYIFLKKKSFWSWKVISILGVLYTLTRSWIKQALYWEILPAEHKQSSLEDISVVLGSASDLVLFKKNLGNGAPDQHEEPGSDLL